MTNENGILRFEENDIVLTYHDSSQKFESSIYGFKLTASGNNLVWIHATEEDYKESESIRKKIPMEEVASKVFDSCQNITPTTCGSPFCSGNSGAPFCRLYYNPQKQYYYCGCSST